MVPYKDLINQILVRYFYRREDFRENLQLDNQRVPDLMDLEVDKSKSENP